MRFRRAFSNPAHTDHADGESDYIAMTDMMVGVLFIFIIMLSFFALQYRQTTVSLTSAKDKQTAVLLKAATQLQAASVTAEVDRAAHIVCVPGAALGDTGTGDTRHCFAYSDTTPSSATALKPTEQIAAADKAALMSGLQSDISTAAIPATVGVDSGAIDIPADFLFATGTATLTPQGQGVVAKVAQSLATHLPCYGYGVPAPASCSSESKLGIVNVVASANINAFTADGRAAAALALQRSVVFHDAVVAAQPAIGQVRNLPPEQAGSRPLLQVANITQSNSDSTAPGNQSVSIQFGMAAPQ